MSKKALSNAEISAFCQQIAMIIDAGLPIYYGISILMDDAWDEETKELLSRIYKPMESGGSFHSALKETGFFPKYMVHMVELGEQTGRLEEVLKSLTVYYEREASIRSSIKNSVTYPLIMTFMMLAVLIVLITKVLPVFSQVYEELGSELTGTARVLMDISNVLNQYLLVFVLLFVVLFVLVLFLYFTGLLHIMFQGKDISLSVAASRFANCMYLALASGLDTDQGLELAHELVNNPYMQEKINKCHEHLRHGEGFSNALLLSGIFSRTYSSMITIGYKTGSMEKVMKKVGEAYEKEVDEKLNRFISILEPTLVIILSLFIGLILISFLLPLLGIMSSIG